MFRDELDRLCGLLAPHLAALEGGLDADLRELLVAADPADAGAAERLARTELAQPALFACELALARQWAAWGVVPDALLGHSLGEYVAATLAGVFDTADAAALVAARGRLMAELPPGAMLGVELPAGIAGAEEWLAALAGGCRRTPRRRCRWPRSTRRAPPSCRVPRRRSARLPRRLAADGVRHRRLHTSHAFHSAMMEPILERFAAEVERRPRHAPRLPVVSNLSGDWLSADEAADAGYWVRHLRRPVRFAAGLARLLEDPERVLLEVGPGRTLSQLARPQAMGRVVVPSLPHPRQPQPPAAGLVEAVGRLWLAGVEIDWPGYAGDRRPRRVPLPVYPFEGRDYLLPAAGRRAAEPNAAEPSAAEPNAAESTARRADPADWFYVPLWRQTVPPADPAPERLAAAGPWLLLLDGSGVLAALAERLGAAGAAVATVEAAEGFVDLGDGAYVLDPAQRRDHAALAAALAAAGKLPRRVVHGLNLAPAEAAKPAAERAAGAGDRVPLVAPPGDHAGGGRGAGGTRRRRRGRCAARRADRRFQRRRRGRRRGAGVPRAGAAARTGAGAAPGLPRPRLPQRRPRPRPAISMPRRRPPPRSPPWPPICSPSCWAGAGEGAGEAAGEPADRVAWRGGRRWVEEHGPLRLESTDGGALRDGGFYWLTGGLGGVGFALAEELAARHGARLLLTGRSELPPPQEWDELLAPAEGDGEGDGEITAAPTAANGSAAHTATATATAPAVAERVRRLRRLEAAGAEVLYLAADVTDRAATAAALARGEERFGPLHGAVHAAGLPGGGLAQTRTAEQAERVLAPKVDGARVLGELLGPRLAAGSLDFLLFTSSINAVAGGFGQSDYAAANAFLDAYAETLPRRRGSRAMAVAWDRWRGVGMATDATGDLLAALAGARTTPTGARDAGATRAGTGALTRCSAGRWAPPPAPGRRLWLGSLAPERCWVLAEHRVLGTPTLPGTSYLEMARAAFAELHPAAPVELTEVAFLAPLAVADGAPAAC